MSKNLRPRDFESYHPISENLRRSYITREESRTRALVETRLAKYYLAWSLLKLSAWLRPKRVVPFEEWLPGCVIGKLAASFPSKSYDAFFAQAIYGFVANDLLFRVGSYAVCTRVKQGVLVVGSVWLVREGELV